IVDKKWVDHIDAMVNLRNGIGLRGYAGKDPLAEYRREAIGMFNQMIEAINSETAIFLFKVRIERKEPPRPTPAPVIAKDVNLKKVGRNDPCPCGSGKKYKQCCGK
ncbi:MAG: SEC-C domain-containing protein, partial [Clostridia bacterium]|nr:SEC-C domain-containing protein [Clostridia bacterium]